MHDLAAWGCMHYQNGCRVRSLRLLAFPEPPEYKTPERWLQQFEGRTTRDPLRVRGEIHGIAGIDTTIEQVIGFVLVGIASELPNVSRPELESVVRRTP